MRLASGCRAAACLDQDADDESQAFWAVATAVAQTLSRTVEVPFGGATMRVVNREDFIAMKCFAGGPQDLEDARIALRTAEHLDLDLLRKVARRFGRPAADALESLLA
jgi:hypothetical protein